MIEINPPEFKDISNEIYHAGPGVSKSNLWTFHRDSPLHSRVPFKSTPAVEFGAMFHSAVEDPDAFERDYVILPDDCRKGTGMKARKEAFIAQCAANEQSVIKQEDHDDIRGMVASIHANQECIDLLEGEGIHEISGYWIDPDTGVLCKCRPDFINKSKRIVVDWKSCVSAKPYRFFSVARDKGYGFQSAYYLYGITQITGVPHDDFRLVAVEKTPPYGIQVHPVEQEVIDYWLSKLGVILERYQECLESNVWPCYEEESPGLGLAPWEKKEMEEY